MVGHNLKIGDRGLSDRLRLYAASAEAGWPASASSRERTSHALQFAGSSRVAARAAVNASVVSPRSSCTSANWICDDAAPGCRRTAVRASASAWESLPLVAADWLSLTELTVA